MPAWNGKKDSFCFCLIEAVGNWTMNCWNVFSSSGSAVILQQHAPTYLANCPHKATRLVRKGTEGIRVLGPPQLHSHWTEHRLGLWPRLQPQISLKNKSLWHVLHLSMTQPGCWWWKGSAELGEWGFWCPELTGFLGWSSALGCSLKLGGCTSSPNSGKYFSDASDSRCDDTACSDPC